MPGVFGPGVAICYLILWNSFFQSTLSSDHDECEMIAASGMLAFNMTCGGISTKVSPASCFLCPGEEVIIECKSDINALRGYLFSNGTSVADSSLSSIWIETEETSGKYSHMITADDLNEQWNLTCLCHNDKELVQENNSFTLHVIGYIPPPIMASITFDAMSTLVKWIAPNFHARMPDSYIVQYGDEKDTLNSTECTMTSNYTECEFDLSENITDAVSVSSICGNLPSIKLTIPVIPVDMQLSSSLSSSLSPNMTKNSELIPLSSMMMNSPMLPTTSTPTNTTTVSTSGSSAGYIVLVIVIILLIIIFAVVMVLVYMLRQHKCRGIRKELEISMKLNPLPPGSTGQ